MISIIVLQVHVVRQGSIELNEIEEVRSISYGMDVLVKPAGYSGRIRRCAAETSQSTACIRRLKFCKVRREGSPNFFMIPSEFIKCSARHHVKLIFQILDAHWVF